MGIVQHLLNKKSDAVVLFVVERVNLVDQQYEQFKQFLSASNILMAKMGGSNSSTITIPISVLVKYNKMAPVTNIIVLTAQVLLNELLRDDDALDLTDISLMIFDECHHCTKEHPYNQIMDHYFSKKIPSSKSMPQIVGLTASPGTDKADDKKKAYAHIVSLMANLNSSSVSYYSEEEFNANNNQTKHERICTPSRSKTYLRDILEAIMESLEKIIFKMIEDKILDNNPKITVPTEYRGEPRYTNFIGNLNIRRLINTEVQHAQRFNSIRQKLDILNRALVIFEFFREIDVKNFLTLSLAPLPESNLPRFDRTLTDKIQKLAVDTPCEDEGEDINPCLLELKKQILSTLETDANSKILVFVQQRSYCKFLLDFFNSDSDFSQSNYKADLVVGHSPSLDPANETISQANQLQILQKFKTHQDTNVLFTTSLTEEGIDVVKCNLVIRYVYVTNEIAMTQSKGRARAAASRYLLIYPERFYRHGLKDQVNVYRHRLMCKAVETICQEISSDSAGFRKKIAEEVERRQIFRVAPLLKYDCPVSQPGADLDLLCGKCMALITTTAVLRNHDNLYISVDKEIENRLHSLPEAEHNELREVYCAGCKHQLLGRRVRCNGHIFHSLMVTQLVFANPDGSKFTAKNWTDKDLLVKEFSHADFLLLRK